MKHHSFALEHAIRIDKIVVGFCGEYFRMSDERRHVVTAYLSAKPPLEDEFERVGDFLRSADHGTILSAAYGVVPEGLRRALGRAGPDAHDAHFYTLLHALLAHAEQPQVRHCIARLSSLDLQKVQVIKYLSQNPHLVHADIVEVIDSVQMAHDAVTAFQLLVARGVDEGELAASLRNVRSKRDFTKTWHTAGLNARALDHPVPASNSYLPILTGSALISAGRKYRNCSGRYLQSLLQDGDRDGFAEARIDGEGAMVHLRFESDVWRLEGIFARQNTRPSRDLRRHVEEHLKAHGVKFEEPKRRETTGWDSWRRIATNDFFDFEA